MPFRFHPVAREELHHAARRYEEAVDGLGFRFTRAVRAAISRIEMNPEWFRVVDDGIRKCRVPRFPYGILVQLHDPEIWVIAIMHLHRDPGYWKERL